MEKRSERERRDILRDWEREAWGRVSGGTEASHLS